MTIESHEQVLLAAMREISEGVLVWSVPGGTVLICNEAAGRILGASAAEVEGRNLDYPWQLADEDGSPWPQQERGALLAVRTGRSQPTRVVRVQRPDGSFAWVRSSSVVLRNASDTPYAVITTFVDITELRQTGVQLKSMAERLAQAMAGANVGTWELDLETGHVVRNARWATIQGLSPEEVEPTFEAFTERIHPDERQLCEAAIAQGLRDEEPYVIECRVKHKDGHWHWVQSRGKVAHWTHDGKARRVAGVLVDVHERKRTEENLRSALAENERLVRALQTALKNVRTLEGLLPICMYCKSIRDNGGAWSSVEAYVTRRSTVAFSHGICPSCYSERFDADQDA